jgi:hypothetical protein
MTLTIDLPEEVGTKLSAEAKRMGLSLPDYVLHLLSTTPGKPLSGAELVAAWDADGLFGSRRDIVDSVAFAQENRRKAESRRMD